MQGITGPSGPATTCPSIRKRPPTGFSGRSLVPKKRAPLNKEECTLGLFGSIWHQSDLTRSLDGDCYLTLMTGTIPGNTARKDLPAVRQILIQTSNFLIINMRNFLHAELTNLLALSASAFTWHVLHLTSYSLDSSLFNTYNSCSKPFASKG